MAGQRRRLILVRHSAPEMVAGLPASQWRLSDEGRSRCEPLADRLVAYDLIAVVSSEEPKAVQTGQIVAEALGLPLQTTPGLHEHERGVVKSIGSKEEFQAQVVRLFEHPGELVLGHETADQAHSRFAAAIADVIERHPSGSLAVVTHGTGTDALCGPRQRPRSGSLLETVRTALLRGTGPSIFQPGEGS